MQLKYAGFWQRFGAFWIDFAVWIPVMGLVYFLSERIRLFQLYWFVPGLVMGLWFHVYLVMRYGGTPGKLALNMRVAMTDGTSVTAKAALIRYSVLFVLSTLTSLALLPSIVTMTDQEYFSLSYVARSQRFVEMAPPWYQFLEVAMQIWIWSEFVTMLFNKKRRAAHDFMAGTVVLKGRRADPAC